MLRDKVTGQIIDTNTTSPDVWRTPVQKPATSLYDTYKAENPSIGLASSSRDTSTTGQYSTPKPPAKPPMTLEGWGQNAMTDLGNIGSGLVGLPGLIAKEDPAGLLVKKIQRTPQVLQQQIDILTKPGTNKYARMVGVQQGASPEIQQAGLIKDVGVQTAKDYYKLATNPVEAFYERPISSTLDVLAAYEAGSKAYKAVKTRFTQAKRATEAAADLNALTPTKKVTPLQPTTPLNAASADLQTKTFNSAFTIPTKRAKDLGPLDVSHQMVDYGIKGGLDDMKKVSDSVTGRTGIVSNAQRQVLSQIPDEIDLNGLNDSVVAYGKSLSLTPDEIEQALNTVHTKVGDVVEVASNKPRTVGKAVKAAKGGTTYVLGDKSITPLADTGVVSAPDTFDIMQQVEKEAAAWKRKSTYLTSVPHAEEMGKLLTAIAKELENRLSTLVTDNSLIETAKTPENISKLAAISPKLAEDFMKVASFRDLRKLQAPFVRLGQMVDLTLWAEGSAASKWAAALGGRVGATMTGGAIAGVPGMVVGAAISPLLEGPLQHVAQTVTPRLVTGMAQTVKRAAPVVANIRNTAQAVKAGGKAAITAALIKKFLEYGPQMEANQSNQPQQPAKLSPIPQQAMTGSMKEWAGYK